MEVLDRLDGTYGFSKRIVVQHAVIAFGVLVLFSGRLVLAWGR